MLLKVAATAGEAGFKIVPPEDEQGVEIAK